MVSFYQANHIVLDFVYTAKMMMGIFDLISKAHFQKGQKILALHTGGVQGNQSKPALNFSK
jgi:1-aminocyclopropane-1-carboxylate deaminase